MSTLKTIPHLATQLVEDGQAVLKAEIRLAKAKAFAKVAAVRTGAILFAAAAVIAFLGLIGLVVGFVLALSVLVNAAVAGLIVLGGSLLIALVLAWMGSRALSGRDKPEQDA